jgi:iron complex outermembrane receptor protein
MSDNVEGYATGSYSKSYVSIKGAPAAVRSDPALRRRPGAGFVQPGYRPAGLCLLDRRQLRHPAAGRRLNPNNPYAAAFAADPANGAARLYYLFGDIPAGSDRDNEVIRGAIGFNGSFGDDWNWRVEAVGARDNLSLTQHGVLSIAGVANAINTGATTSSTRRRTRPPCATWSRRIARRRRTRR